MKTFLNIVVGLLLLFNAFGAIYGGWSLITHTDGSGLGMTLDLLKGSPFSNYLIPGIVLFVANGLFGFFVFFSLVFRFRSVAFLIIAQGAILLGWIIIQIFMIQTFDPLHVIMGTTGIALIVFGWLLKSPKFI